MLTIHTNKNIKDKILLTDIEAEFNIESTKFSCMYYDKKSEYILKTLEGMKSRTGDIIESKFGAVLLTSISTGCKAMLLCATKYKDRAICLDEVGNNAIKILPMISKDIDLHVFTHRVLKYFPENFQCYVEDEICIGNDITLALAELLDKGGILMIDTLEITTKIIKIKLNLANVISVATGYSSTGKTFMVTKLKELQNVNKNIIDNSNIDIADILIIDTLLVRDAFISNYKKYKNKFVIIDRYDYLQNDELNNIILRGDTQFLLMSHTQYELLDLHTESFIFLEYNKDTNTFENKMLVDCLDSDMI